MEKKRLKKRIQRKIIKLLSIVSLIIVLLCSLIAALYETPLAIFLPRLDEGQNVATVFIGQDETGMEQIGEALQPYYEKFNADVYQKKDGEDMEVRYNRKETNFWEVVQVYACIAGTTEFQVSSGMVQRKTTVNPCIINDNTRPILEDVFNKMVTSQTSYENVVDAKDGDSIGTYLITCTREKNVYDKESEIRQCVVSNSQKNKIPLKSVLKIGSKKYRVTSYGDLDGGAAISLCLNEGEKIASVGKNKKVYFCASDEVKEISHKCRIVTVDYMSASAYIQKYGLSDDAQFYFDEMGRIDDKMFSKSTRRSVDIVSRPLNLSEQELIDRIGSAAVSCYDTYELLPSMVIAQAILESGWGKSKLSTECFNFFGMKWTVSCGCDYKEYQTKEQRPDGSYYTITARFRKYNSIDEGIQGYCDFMQYARYQNLRGVTDYEQACDLVRADGWATSLSYSENLKKLIRTYNLTIYDDYALKR